MEGLRPFTGRMQNYLWALVSVFVGSGLHSLVVECKKVRKDTGDRARTGRTGWYGLKECYLSFILKVQQFFIVKNFAVMSKPLAIQK